MERRTVLTKQKRFLWRKFQWLVPIAISLIMLPYAAFIVFKDFKPGILGLYLLGWLPAPTIYWLWLRRKPNLVRQLNSHDALKRQQAFKQLLKMGEKAIPIFVQALNTPTRFPSPVGIWIDNEAHLLAVEGLGLLKAKGAVGALIEALEHPNADVRAKAAWALGEIGDKQVIPYLIPLLGDTAVSKDTPSPKFAGRLSFYWAAEALRKLGESELVEAFEKALRQRLDEPSRQCLQGTYRQEVAKALMKALESGRAYISGAAAWALGELKMMEALPKLERKARSPLTEGWVREKCQEAIAKLKPLSALPRPATSPSLDTGTLPRPAVPSQISVNTLPSPAEPPKDDKSD